MKHILIIWTLLLLSCGTKTSNSITDNNSDTLKQNTTATKNSENFNDFLDRFRTDSLFQIERVKFPFTLQYWDTDVDKPTADKIEISNWRHLKFEYNDEYAKRQIDAYTQETKIYADSAKIELRGVDNGILIDFEFHKINGQWTLVSEKDYSN